MNSNKLILILFFIIAIFSNLNCSAQITSKTETDSQLAGKQSLVDDSYSVYSALLEAGRNSVQQHVILEDIVIDNGAVAGKTKIPIDKVIRNINLTLPAEYKPAFEDYKLKNKEASKLNDKESLKLAESFDLQNKYVLINNNDLKSIYNGKNPNDYWKAFYEKYPKSGGYVLFSQVGFDTEKKHAFVYMQFYCGSLCADGSYFLLEKENGKWKETKRAMLWAS